MIQVDMFLRKYLLIDIAEQFLDRWTKDIFDKISEGTV